MIYITSADPIFRRISQSTSCQRHRHGGIAVAIQMGGGVVSGSFRKMSENLVLPIAAAPYWWLYAHQPFGVVLVMIFIGIFTSVCLSLMLPRCIFAVSTLVDKSTRRPRPYHLQHRAQFRGPVTAGFTRLESLFSDATITGILWPFVPLSSLLIIPS